MKHFIWFIIFPILGLFENLSAQENSRIILDLNGQWDFEQTITAFPPEQFSRKCPVPGLIHLARPKIEQYDVFFNRPESPVSDQSHNLMNMDYVPKYSWYKRNFKIPDGSEQKEAVITIKKAQYVTQVYVNGMDVGQSMACYTPIEFNVTDALRFGEENEILIRVGDRAWLPSQAAGSTDKEKVHYLPGIWDDVILSFTGKLRIDRTLILPSVANREINFKVRIRSYYPPQMEYGDPMADSCRVRVSIIDPETNGIIGTNETRVLVKRDNISMIEGAISLGDFVTWSPEQPKLYIARVSIRKDGRIQDEVENSFGIRDFTRRGKHFYLNGRKTYLRGTNITLQRFFEDPDCSDLAWDREWVKHLLVDIPKKMDWNAMRICVGIVPDFWYDIADEYGIMFQNEWFYWQNHGWDDQVKKEYTDWVWTDGNHPSIVIWDAINENWDPYIGNVLIPELKVLDPTRIWDAGYMTSSDMILDEMDEPHPYRAGWGVMIAEDIDRYLKENPYQLGDLNDWPENMQRYLDASTAQLVNEYGWIWLWRDGQPAKLTKNLYDYVLGEQATAHQRREMQAYWLQLETEWLRSERSFAGVLSFCYLANNYGYTGDWFVEEIKDLKEGPTLKWFRHCFAPKAVFIDLPDQRYMDNGKYYQPGEKVSFNLIGVNDTVLKGTGSITLEMIDPNGTETHLFSGEISINGFGKTYQPVIISMPDKSGGYLLKSTFVPAEGRPMISRRYLRVGSNVGRMNFYELEP
jgi:beta-galactosidase